MFSVTIDIEHAALPDINVCNEEFQFLISKNDKNVTMYFKCSPSQALSGIYSSNATEITILFKREVATNSDKKAVVGLGIQGKLI